MMTRQSTPLRCSFRGSPRIARIIGSISMLLLMSVSAEAVSVAVFGDNLTDDTINSFFGAGSATLVSDAQLATPGFLAPFDAVYVTRDGASFGSSLSAAAATEVQAYVGATGNVVLLVGDYADALGFSGPADPNVVLLTTNAVSYAAASGHGYIGEFNGASMGFAANSNSFLPLGFIPGTDLGLNCCPSDGDIDLTQPGHAVLTGLPDPVPSPGDLEYGSGTVGVPNANVIARYVDTGDVAVAIRPGVPEPASIVIAIIGLFAIGALNRGSRD